MALLEFRRLRERFECRETNRRVTVLFYSKVDGEFVFHSNSKKDTKEWAGLVKSRLPDGCIGEKFIEKERLFICLGNKQAANITAQEVFKAVNGSYKMIPNKTDVRFEECQFVRHAIHALIIEGYSYDFLKQSKQTKSIFINAPEHTSIVEKAHAQNIARFFGDTPANLMTPRLFVEYAKQFLGIDTDAEYADNLVVDEFDGKFIKSEGMNLIMSVTQGSAEEPRLLRVRYQGKDQGSPDIALVGKGVTFDSGGISIKPSQGMAAMKSDMMGAATLLAVIHLVARMKLKVNVIGCFPLVENLPGPSATKPGDVFTSLSDKTVEVDNTDAEGRLVLADAITFALRDKPKYLIDAATLTGSIVVGLGYVYSGYYCNDEEFAKLIEKSISESSEMVWRMPLSELYREAMKSEVADLINASGRDGGTAKGAAFLEEFVDGVRWAHFDIAGMMGGTGSNGIYSKYNTGRPMLALFKIVENLANQ